MAGRLAAVPEESMDVSTPEESMDVSTAAYPPRSPYRDFIRRIVVSRRQIRSTLFSHSQSDYSGSSYSSDSGTSNPSNNSGCSSYSASAAAADFCTQELKTIVRRMASDGYTQLMVQAFSDASPGPAALRYNGDLDHELNTWFSALLQPFDMVVVPATPTHVYSNDQDRVLETWFLELDVDWVLQIRQEHGSQWQLRLQGNSGSSLQELVERWIRGLTVMVHSILELQPTTHEMKAVKRFGEASISKMHIFVDAMVPALKAENLGTLLDMHICLGRAMYHMENSGVHPELVHFPLLYLSLAAYKLRKAISSTMEKVRTLVDDNDSWTIEMPRGGGEVHRTTRWIADCIVSLGEAEASQFFASIINSTSLLYNSTRLSGVRYDTIGYLKDLLVNKAELYLDPSLRYLFLLNNLYFVAQMCDPCETTHGSKLTPKCEEYIHSYLDVSWGHVLSCIPKLHFPGPIHRWINTSSLVKFESAFNKTYQAQKFWKVPDPRLRDILRRAITDRVVSSYREYLKEHPELAEQVSRRNNTPKVLEDMLGQLFEG